MKFRHLSATFGRLSSQTLDLGPGLNILEAPNETGKSTWCAFLLAMLYGIDSRQRDKAGFIADKNRYSPWSGAAMSGRLECSTQHDNNITLQRETRRANAPMGQFTAQYTGSSETVPGLTAQNCGEVLLGVPREVYERSAFIRQAGLGISANAELERRIISLITTGDEGTSYSESYAALKKQLNRRRHNKTGELPTAETELADIRQQLTELQKLQQDLLQAKQSLSHAEQQYQHAQGQLAARKQYDSSLKFAALEEAKQQAEEASDAADLLGRHLTADRIPENETILRLQGAIDNLTIAEVRLKAAEAEQEAATQALRSAEAEIKKSPFSGLSPEQAKNLPLDSIPQPRFPVQVPVFAALIGLVAAIGLFVISHSIAIAITAFCAFLGLHTLAASLRTARKRRQWESQTAELQQQRELDLANFLPLHQALTAAQAAADKASAHAEVLRHTLTVSRVGILEEVRRFAPSAFDIAAAKNALEESTARRKSLAAAETAAQQAAMRWEVLKQQLADTTPISVPIHVPAPQQTQEELEAELAQLQSNVALRASLVNRLAGQISAAGDPAVLAAKAEELESTISALSAEYDAISLAMSTLDNANTALQTRFSPALGRRAAEIFRELTENRYSGVILDRSFHLAAEPTGDTVYRDAQLLSAGAADQLYLAVRLAICELVLPADSPPPMVLDDALANYDDQRCAAALRWLRKEAEHRQILLFTCHHREGEFFQNDPEVLVQRLTNDTQQV